MAGTARALEIRGVLPRVLFVCLLSACSAGAVFAQSLGTVALQPAPASDRILSADGSGPVRVAVGWSGAACVSEDGAAWNRVETGVTAALRAVVRTPTGFLAAGDAGTILTSSNGTAWTKRASGIGSPLYCASTGGGLQLVGGGAGRVLTSPDGIVWTLRSTGTIAGVTGLAYGNGTHVAVCESGEIMASADGAVWSKETTPATGALSAVAYSGGQFVVVGALGEVLTSADGSGWTRRRLSGSSRLRAVAEVSGGWMAVGDGGLVLTSSDGISWSETVLAGAPDLVGLAGGTGAAFAFAGDGGVWKFEGTWNLLDPRNGGNFYAVTASGAGVFVAAGSGGRVVVSANGTDWSSAGSPTTEDLNGLVHGAGKFVAVGNNGTIIASTDGANWMSAATGTGANLLAVAHGTTGFVAVGQAGVCARSADGLAWTVSAIAGSLDDFHAVAFGNGTYVAVGRWGRIATSADGAAWTLVPEHPTEKERWLDFTGITFLDGLFVAATRASTTFSSSDGITWTRRTTAMVPGTDFHGVLALGDRFAVFGDGGTVQTSPDGGSWVAETRATSNALRAAAYFPGRAVFVGDRGTILATMRGIRSHPASISVGAGESGTLAVGVDGTGPFVYQWFRGVAGDESHPVAGATGAALSINPGPAGGSFWVRVADGLGSFDSLPAAILVSNGWTAFHAGWAAAGDGANTTTGAAKGVPVPLKSSTSGLAAGNVTLTYNWTGTYNVRTDNKTGWQAGTDAHGIFSGGVGLGTQADNVASAGNSTITLAGLEPGGTYELAVYAGRDSSLFAATNLNNYELINATVKSTAHSPGVTAPSSNAASVAVGLGCKAAGRVVRWTFEAVGTSVVLRTSAGGGAANSVIPQAVRLVAVSEVPVVTSGPASQEISAGNPATLQASVAGSGLTHQWFRRLPGEDFVSLTGETSSQLALTAVDSSAEYFVRVSGTGGFVDSPAAGVVVKRTFEQWASREGLGSGDPVADSDGDGLRDLLEFALGLDPLERSSGTGFRMDGEEMVLSYTVSREAAGVVVVPETSSSLQSGSWTPVVPAALPRSVFVSENLEVRIPAGAGRAFLRIRASSL